MLDDAKSDYLIIITASDTPSGPLFTSYHSAAMMNALELKTNMVEAYRQPYIAIIDCGKVTYEETLQDVTKSLKVSADFKDKKIFVYSGGFACTDEYAYRAFLKVNDNYFFGTRGYNFFVFNAKYNYLVDLYMFETFKLEQPERPLFKPFANLEKLYSIINNSSCGGITYCLFNQPGIPSPQHRSKQEQLLYKYQFTLEKIRKNDKLCKDIWDNKAIDFCNDFNSMNDMKEAFSPPDSYNDITGVLKFKDHTSNVVNTRNGIRVTTDQPATHKRAIFLVGPCTTFGIGADDSHTIASFLQRKFNEFAQNENFIVYNYGYFVGGMEDGAFDKLLPVFSSIPAKKGDIVFLFHTYPIVEGLPYCESKLKSERPHKYGEIFIDYVGHFSANGHNMIADGLFDFLKEHDFFKDAVMKITRIGEASSPNDKTIDTKDTTNTSENPLLTKYKNELKIFFKEKLSPKIGAIVMNANPFTYGHRYLIETALKCCDYLIIFVVEEDKSEIPFIDRFKLVKANVKDLPDVFARPSGEFIISSKTFSEYFRKESLQEQKIDTTLDVTLFAKEIAPCLNISVRFAGKEPTDKITEQYNRDMAQILPQYDIEFVEIERKQTDSGEIISASTVRKLAKEKKFDKLKTLAPPATIEYLRKKYE